MTCDLEAFAGRILVSCPTRGGDVFERVVSLLTTGRVDSVPISNLSEKVKTILTGKLGEEAVIAKGTSWAHCAIETARKLQEVVGEDVFMQIQLEMCGTWGHVYRQSDIPNRHGHCNSSPNPELTMKFAGFKNISI